jgi:hypothetical protein
VLAETRIGHRLLGAVVLAGERRSLALEHRQDDLQRLVQLVEAIGEGAELVAELIVLELEPAGADAEYRPALTSVPSCTRSVAVASPPSAV